MDSDQYVLIQIVANFNQVVFFYLAFSWPQESHDCLNTFVHFR